MACLWAGQDAVASHDTALAVYELTDAMPAEIHITVPHPFRGRRPGVVVHTAPLDARERTVRAAVPVTTVARTIADVLRRSGSDLAVEAAREALDRGLVTRHGCGQRWTATVRQHVPSSISGRQPRDQWRSARDKSPT